MRHGYWTIAFRRWFGEVQLGAASGVAREYDLYRWRTEFDDAVMDVRHSKSWRTVARDKIEKLVALSPVPSDPLLSDFPEKVASFSYAFADAVRHRAQLQGEDLEQPHWQREWIAERFQRQFYDIVARSPGDDIADKVLRVQGKAEAHVRHNLKLLTVSCSVTGLAAAIAAGQATGSKTAAAVAAAGGLVVGGTAYSVVQLVHDSSKRQRASRALARLFLALAAPLARAEVSELGWQGIADDPAKLAASMEARAAPLLESKMAPLQDVAYSDAEFCELRAARDHFVDTFLSFGLTIRSTSAGSMANGSLAIDEDGQAKWGKSTSLVDGAVGGVNGVIAFLEGARDGPGYEAGRWSFEQAFGAMLGLARLLSGRPVVHVSYEPGSKAA